MKIATPNFHNIMKDVSMNNRRIIWTSIFSRRRIKKKTKEAQDDSVLASMTCCTGNDTIDDSRKHNKARRRDDVLDKMTGTLSDSSHHSETTCATANDEEDNVMMSTTKNDVDIQEEQNEIYDADLIFEYNRKQNEKEECNSTKCYMTEIPNNVQDGDAFFVKAGTTLLEMLCPQYYNNRRRREDYNMLVFELVPCGCDLCCYQYNRSDDTVLVRRKRRHYPQLQHVRVVNSNDFLQFTRDIETLTQQPNVEDKCSSLNKTIHWKKGWNSFTNIHIEQLRLALKTTKSFNTSLKRIFIANAPTQILDAILNVLVMSDNAIECADEKRLIFQNKLEVQLDVTI